MNKNITRHYEEMTTIQLMEELEKTKHICGVGLPCMKCMCRSELDSRIKDLFGDLD